MTHARDRNILSSRLPPSNFLFSPPPQPSSRGTTRCIGSSSGHWLTVAHPIRHYIFVARSLIVRQLALLWLTLRCHPPHPIRMFLQHSDPSMTLTNDEWSRIIAPYVSNTPLHHLVSWHNHSDHGLLPRNSTLASSFHDFSAIYSVANFCFHGWKASDYQNFDVPQFNVSWRCQWTLVVIQLKFELVGRKHQSLSTYLKSLDLLLTILER